ncbi:MAG: hypothetical protein M0T74_00745 [Desulfitobacterium hafniense]|nr:hypothetical protein [Desulfitobacterium hafniense]
MITGILITARLGSARLKKKHLLEVKGHPILWFLIKRIRDEFDLEVRSGKVKLIIATTDEPEDEKFEQFSAEGVSVFYGSTNNIPLRHLQTAKAHHLESIISVDGDDILCSVKGMRMVYNLLAEGHDYVMTSNLPFGMNSWGYSVEFLNSSMVNHMDDVLETGWGRIFDAREPVYINVFLKNKNDLLRFTLDYQDDYHFFKTLIEAMGEVIYRASDQAIIDFVLENNLYSINEDITRDYWNNFYKQVEEEKQSSKRFK